MAESIIWELRPLDNVQASSDSRSDSTSDQESLTTESEQTLLSPVDPSFSFITQVHDSFQGQTTRTIIRPAPRSPIVAGCFAPQSKAFETSKIAVNQVMNSLNCCGNSNAAFEEYVDALTSNEAKEFQIRVTREAISEAHSVGVANFGMIHPEL
ncbi:hypothetical protein C8J56DRAFT_1043981 [Mycena floridula]|nr:hypothetical protein C8J56DRAFT_1043981 [Mycena floridula]